MGNHWRQSTGCGYPELSDEQLDVIEGVLLSDGWLARQWKHSCVEIESTKKSYLEHRDRSVFPDMGGTISMKKDSDEVYEDAMARDTLVDNITRSGCSDIYSWRTIRHPKLNQYNHWYDGGEKTWPEDIELNPLTFKHLYVGDGSYHQKDNYMKITTVNEMGNKDKVEHIFSRSGIEIGNVRYDEHTEKVDIFLSKSESERMFSVMGNPVPGFEYKWPEEMR
jgi:hypothetical protein